jgi:glutathione synthase/RimK-type ligase-like ATP-grasp enzyme
MPNSRVALLTDSRYTAARAPDGDWYLANILEDDRLLGEALAAQGISSVRVDWADRSVDWSQFQAAVFRTTWDYFDRFEEFQTWFSRVEKQTRLINSPQIILWNRDKHYLQDLESQGITIVPTRYLEIHDRRRLREHLGEWDHAVVKPCVSGGARHTHRVNRETVEEIETTLAPILTRESFLIQPFQNSILTTGEDSLMFFDGQYTHAVRKSGSQGDFRVQDDFGGTYVNWDPPRDQIEFAERAVRACEAFCGSRPVYARVDLVRSNDGRWAVMELEMIEPELWLRQRPESARAFAMGIVAALR